MSASDGENSSASDSECDEEEYESKRINCLRDMLELERQFNEIKELLYQERRMQIDDELSQVRSGNTQEAIEKMRQLEEMYQLRNQNCERMREMQIAAVEVAFESAVVTASQDLENEKQLQYDAIKADINSKIRQLEMDRYGDFREGPTDPSNNSLSLSAEFDMEERKSAIVVSGPYIVYQLPEKDIYDDLIAIRRGIRDSEV